MWEITLVGQEQDYEYFVLLEDKLKKSLEDKPIIAISGQKNLCCSIAISNKNKLKLVKKYILEIIIKICKEEYFRENLEDISFIDNFINDFILFSLINVNLSDEVDYAYIKVKFSKILHIRSLAKFRLRTLYSVWDKFIAYFNSVKYNFAEEEMYLEFLKFLASSSITENEVMYLEQKNNMMIISDKNKNSLSSVPIDDEIGVVVNLILLSPKN